MKEAQDLHLITTIVDEKSADSPFALVFHTDHAVDLMNITLEEQFPQTITENKEESKEPKKGFWQKVFGK
jgi:uncharacterized protein YueI